MKREHIYTSAKGENFLTLDEWLRLKLTIEEYDFYKEVDYRSEEHKQNYNKWIIKEEIIRHKYIEDDIEVFDIEVYPN